MCTHTITKNTHLRTSIVCVCLPLNFMVAIAELRKFVCGMWMYMVKVYWQLSLLPLSYFIIFIFISFHFVFSIWFNLMWSIQYLFFHHLSIYLSTAHYLSFSSYCPNDGNGCVCVVCGVCVSLCAFRSFCHHEDMCDGWMAGFNILLRVFVNLTCLRINHMSYDISHYIL